MQGTESPQASESPQSVLVTREYQGTSSSDGCNSDDTGNGICALVLCTLSLSFLQ